MIPARTATADQPPRPIPSHPDLLWLVCAGALIVALAIPFFLIDVPPVQDYPNHLARYFVLAHPDDPTLAQIYAPAWRILPNLGMDVLGMALLKVLPVHVGGRILLAVSLFAPVIGVIVFSRVMFGRFLYWPLASGVMAYNGIFHLGFMNFLLSLGMALIGAAVWLAMRRRDSALGAALVGAVAAAVIFFCHIFGVILFGVLLGGLELARLVALRQDGKPIAVPAITTAVLGLAVLAPVIVLYLASPLADGGQAFGEWGGRYKLAAFLTPFATYSKAITVITAVALLVFLVLNRTRLRMAPGIGIALLALLLIYAVVPIAIGRGSFIDSRLGVMMGLLLFAGFAPDLPRRSALIFASLFAALIAGRTVYIASVWIDHRHDLADLSKAISYVPEGARVMSARGYLGYQTDNVSHAGRALPGFYRLDGHLAALMVIERRAFWPLLFADATQQPLVVRPPYAAISHPLQEAVHWPVLQQQQFTAENLEDARYLPGWRDKFDYVLLIDPPAALTVPQGLQPIVTTGFAILYRIER